MDIELFVVCDAATDTAGKLNILGAFDSIVVQAVPATHPQCSVVLRIRFARAEAGKHQIQISLIDADGKAVVPALDAKVNVAFRAAEQQSLATNLIMNLQRLQLKEAGEYSVGVAMDGRHERSIPLAVHLRPRRRN